LIIERKKRRRFEHNRGEWGQVSGLKRPSSAKKTPKTLYTAFTIRYRFKKW